MATDDNRCIERWHEPSHLPTPAPDNEDPQAPTHTRSTNIHTYSNANKKHDTVTHLTQHPRQQLGVDKAEKCSSLIKITQETTLQRRRTLTEINCWHLSGWKEAGIDCEQEGRRPVARFYLGTFAADIINMHLISTMVSIRCSWTAYKSKGAYPIILPLCM